MTRLSPVPTRTDTRFPYTTICRPPRAATYGSAHQRRPRHPRTPTQRRPAMCRRRRGTTRTTPGRRRSGAAGCTAVRRSRRRWHRREQIGRAAGRGKVGPDVEITGVAVTLKKKKKKKKRKTEK